MYEAFSNIEVNNLVLLSRIIEESSGEIEFVKNKYSSYASFYGETAQFLIGIEIVEEREGNLKYLGNKYKGKNKIEIEGHIEEIILLRLLAGNNTYKKDVHEYLSKYIHKDSSYVYNPSYSVRIQESAIRNVLIDLNIIIHIPEEKSYVINDIAIPYILVNLNKKYIDASKLEEILESKKVLGLEAELVVLSYEKARIGNLEGRDIEHISRINVSAGYDIRSWTIEKEEWSHRYIEVKATSAEQINFYWSRNELEQSRKMGSNYYLYLLPVDIRKKFDIENLIIIRDPYNNVFLSDEWPYEIETYHFSKKK